MSLVAYKSDVKEVLSLLASAELTSGPRVLCFTNASPQDLGFPSVLQTS